MKNFPNLIKSILVGYLIGVANIIPGVSGGTMALMLGIYERLIAALNGLGLGALQTCLKLFSRNRYERENAILALKQKDIFFLLLIGAGAGAAIISMSKVIRYLVQEWHDPTYGFFLGLVVISIYAPAKMLRRFRILELVALSSAAVLAVSLTFAMSGEERLANAKRKQELKDQVVVASETSSSESSLQIFGQYMIGGAIAITAMILPGISGSFMLLLMGMYFDILVAIDQRDILIVGAVASGCVVGLLLFPRLLTYLLRHYHDLTIAFLIGLMIGSIPGIWPFQTFEVVGGKRIDISPIVPAFDINLVQTLVATGVGMAIVALFYCYESKVEKV